jgi:hypothetical protein
MKYTLIIAIFSVLFFTSCKKCYRCSKQKVNAQFEFAFAEVPEVKEECVNKKQLKALENDGFNCLRTNK